CNISTGTAIASSPASMARTTASIWLASSSPSSGIPLGLGGLSLLDDLLRDVRRRLFVVGELELEVAAPAGHRAQIGGVTQHLRHGHVRLDGLLAGAFG